MISNGFLYIVPFLIYIGCNRCGTGGNKPASFVAALSNSQSQEVIGQTGFDGLSSKTSPQTSTNWFQRFADQGNTNRNQPATMNTDYSFGMDRFLHPVFNRYIIWIKRNQNGKTPIDTSLFHPTFRYPLRLLNIFRITNFKNEIVKNERSEAVPNVFQNISPVNMFLTNPLMALIVRYIKSRPIYKEHNGKISYKSNGPSTGIFSRSVNANLGTENLSSLLKRLRMVSTTRSVFKDYIRPERNPCYSEHVNSSGVYYYYDIRRVLKYLHGYSGWKSNNSVNNQAKTMENTSKTSTVINGTIGNKTETSYTNNNPNFERKIKNMQVDSTESNDNQKINNNFNNPVNNKLDSLPESKYNLSDNPYQNPLSVEQKNVYKSEISIPTVLTAKDTIYRNIHTHEGIKYGNVYADPDESPNYLKGTQNDKLEYYNGDFRRVLNPRQKILMDALDTLDHDFNKKMELINEYNTANTFDGTVLSPIKEPQMVTSGRVYANPDVID